MKPEARYWRTISSGMGTRWLAQRHEDRHSNSIPDVSFTTNRHGWIELKCLAKYPKGVLKINHLTPGQRNWLKSRGAMSGNCWILVKVDSDSYLIPWDKIDLIGISPLSDIMKESGVYSWVGGINYDELKSALSL
jgi:hypothetical protein